MGQNFLADTVWPRMTEFGVVTVHRWGRSIFLGVSHGRIARRPQRPMIISHGEWRPSAKFCVKYPEGTKDLYGVPRSRTVTKQATVLRVWGSGSARPCVVRVVVPPLHLVIATVLFTSCLPTRWKKTFSLDCLSWPTSRGGRCRRTNRWWDCDSTIQYM